MPAVIFARCFFSDIIPQMPLRDHFHPPLSEIVGWESLHATWPALMVLDLNKYLPSRYRALPRVHVGQEFELDVAARDYESLARSAQKSDAPAGAEVAWAPPVPTLVVDTEPPGEDEYEVQIYDQDWGKVVAAVEIVSERNKDRPENRRVFSGKCAALLQRGVFVCIIDIVTSRHANLYREILDVIGESDPALSPEAPDLYAVGGRWRAGGRAWHLNTWLRSLVIGHELSTLPLWLDIDFAVPLNLESTYEATCAALRIDYNRG